MQGTYILVNGVPTPERDLRTWAAWFEDSAEERRVARTDLADGCFVSTVFLGLNHDYVGGPPLLYETLVFGGPLADEMERYSTVEHALEGHAQMVKRVQACLGSAPPPGRAGEPPWSR